MDNYKREYVKTDKNGTKYYDISFKCDKCRGSGFIANLWQYEGGICYECHGAGRIHREEKEYTPEYEAKLNARRAKKAEERKAKQDAKAKEVWAKMFPTNKIWFILGNTFELKEQIKADGGKWEVVYKRWYFTEEPKAEYQVFKVDADKVYNPRIWIAGAYNFDYQEGELIEIPVITEGEHIGTIGEKLELDVTYTRYSSYEFKPRGAYYKQVMHIYEFKDDAGNTLVWKTSSYPDIPEEGSRVKLKGTVKEHTEYRNTKQTVLVRCKVTVV